MIHEVLVTGKENAQTGRELAAFFKCDIRLITSQIEKERRDGQPICATSGENPGYYLAADGEELAAYCNKLKRRALELFKTRQALIYCLRRYTEGAMEHGENASDQ